MIKRMLFGKLKEAIGPSVWHVSKTDSAVCVIHIPTGVVVE